jgi:hypothetical protein
VTQLPHTERFLLLAHGAPYLLTWEVKIAKIVKPKTKWEAGKYEFQHSDIFIVIQNHNVPVMKFLFDI